MNLELYENPVEKGLRIKLESRAEAIVELKHRLSVNIEDEELRSRIKKLSDEIENIVTEFYVNNPESTFYVRFQSELPVLTRKQKVTHQKTTEEEKLYLIKQVVRHGKHNAMKQETPEEIE